MRIQNPLIMKSNMKKLTIYMSAALLLSSCGLYNKYERPDVDVTGIVRDPVSLTDTLAVTDTTSFGNMPWRSVFTDPQLQTLIETGLQNNPDLLNAALNVQMVNEALKIAKLAFLPSLALSPQGTLTSFDGAAATKSYTLPVSASWNVDLFGNLLSVKRSAQMQLVATKDYQTVVKCNLISGIANLLCAIKMAKYYEMEEHDVIATVMTDSAVMYQTRIQELVDQDGEYTPTMAAVDYNKHLLGQGTDNMLELRYTDRKRIHNLKYYTWIEQQARDIQDLNDQWYDFEKAWGSVQKQADEIDELINDFNDRTGLLKNL